MHTIAQKLQDGSIQPSAISPAPAQLEGLRKHELITFLEMAQEGNLNIFLLGKLAEMLLLARGGAPITITIHATSCDCIMVEELTAPNEAPIADIDSDSHHPIHLYPWEESAEGPWKPN